MGFNCRGGSIGRVQGVRTPPSPRDDLRFSNTTGILQKKLCDLLEETSAPPPKKNPGSAPELCFYVRMNVKFTSVNTKEKMHESREWTFTFTNELPCIASIYFTYTLKIYMRTQAKILLPRSCKNKTTCPKETTVNLSIFAAFHTTYLKSGRPFTFNDYDPEERNSKVALWGLLYHTPR